MRNKPNLYYGPPGDPATMLYGSQAHVIPPGRSERLLLLPRTQLANDNGQFSSIVTIQSNNLQTP